MRHSSKISLLILASFFSTLSFGSEGCLKKLNEQKILREEFLKSSKKQLHKKTLVAGGSSVAIGAFFPPAGLVVMGGMMVDNTLQTIKDKKRANTHAVLDVSSRIELDEKFHSNDHISLGIFNSLKLEVEKKLEKSISDEKLARIIVRLDESSDAFCSINEQDILLLNPLNKTLRELILSEVSKEEI